ncbi:adenylosuccinate synthetase [Spiroplasma sp. TIUS-1]|uniref:adenylosuccinate synthase n=1 Tax=Spiroplasma sp. TIUS-1 TaxID=216963 RepID=UPI00139856AA|nr:adenylosuccinate synthase [Spiroplasma sp. TIUS-1]QHX35597.1 adenylosuccinate synthetase [Spiroplasma sp. TIUS-1]
MEKFKTLTVVGTQWGDEGKGKMTDYFAQQANIVARFAGGDNAGHVIKFNGQKHKVTIIPSGIFNKDIVNVIGNGCVVNLKSLVNEYNKIKETGLELGELYISDRAHLIFDVHKEIDGLQEEAKGANKIGTTKRGIGPTYQDKVSRIGIRLGELSEPNFKERFYSFMEEKNQYISKIYKSPKIDVDVEYKELMRLFEIIKVNVIDTGEYLYNEIKAGKKVLFEGAQGVMLDIDHGTYPFVTSSNTTANNASTGSGLPNKMISNVMGVVKAYTTRVGAGAIPTEQDNKIGDYIREKGNEYGSNTGRPRRVGWLDCVALKNAIRTSGIDYAFITLLDVLTGLEEIKICTEYELNGKRTSIIPSTNSQYEKCIPIYKTMKGWTEDITGVKTFKELPKAAIEYLKKIEAVCGIEVIGFSVGPDRTQTIIKRNII